MSGLKSSRSGKWAAIKNLDAFPRAEDHLMQKTSSGAAVSAVGLIIMAILFIHELRFYLETVTVHEMSVDVKRGEKLPIHINMTFPALPCEVLSLDAIDMSGKHEVDLDTNIWKLRIHRDGYVLGSEYVNDLVEGEHKKEEEKIGHKDEHKEGDHVEVKEHAAVEEHGHGHEHDEHGIHDGAAGMPIHSHLSQKDPQKVIKEVKKAIEQGEGCQIFGVLDVERVAGNFHISMHGLSVYVASKIFETGYEVNVSHIIHDLSFGPSYPGVHNPLDGSERILHDISGTFKYFLKIVPTEYHHIHGEIMPTNQFSVTEYFQRMKPSDRSYPAVYFVYDLSPIVVTITEHQRNFGHFITRLCAVLGGTFALTGMLDRWMFRIIELMTSTAKGSLF
jgi:hypothetical protein